MNKNLITKLQALAAKTVDNGCTEAEAHAAAKKLTELMTIHGIGLAELQEQKTEDSMVGKETWDSGKKSEPIESGILVIVAEHFDCGVIRLSSKGRTYRYAIFGIEQDRKATMFLFDIFRRAAKHGWKYFLKTRQNTERKSFYIGFVNRMYNRLCEIKKESIVMSGRPAVVPVKNELVQREIEREYGDVRDRRSRAKTINRTAYNAGVETANNTRIVSGITEKESTLIK